MSRKGIVSRAGEDIAAEIVMMRTATQGPFIIVEGPTDERFLWPRVRKDCYISIGSGRISVERAVSILDQANAGQASDYVGIVDEDYDWLINYQPASANVVKTDPRDIEGMLFRSCALDAVLAEFADRAVMQQFERAEGSILEAILSRAEPFGRIRMLNSSGPMVDLSSFKPVRFCRADWTYDVNEAVQQAVALGVAPDTATLSSQMAALQMPDIWHCVRGHDLVDILVGGLIFKLGGGGVSRLEVEKVLRQALSPAEFAGSLLHFRLSQWEIGKSALLN